MAEPANRSQVEPLWKVEHSVQLRPVKMTTRSYWRLRIAARLTGRRWIWSSRQRRGWLL